jgi:hypothetical protein
MFRAVRPGLMENKSELLGRLSELENTMSAIGADLNRQRDDRGEQLAKPSSDREQDGPSIRVLQRPPSRPLGADKAASGSIARKIESNVDADREQSRQKIVKNKNNMVGAQLRNADLSGLDLTDSNFIAADLSNADLSITNLDFTSINGVNLAGANLSHAVLSRANLSGANLEMANIDGITGWQAIRDISGANIRGLKNASPEFHKWAVANGARE